MDRSRSVPAALGRRRPWRHHLQQSRPAPRIGLPPARTKAPRLGVLGALPVRQCEAIILHTHSSLSRRQAAEVMGISVGAVSSHLARGMSSLRHPPQPE